MTDENGYGGSYTDNSSESLWSNSSPGRGPIA